MPPHPSTRTRPSRPPASRRTERPKLVTPAFLLLSVASLAYFTAAGMTIPALPALVTGPLAGGDLAVGIVFGTFSVSAVLLRPIAGVSSDRRGRRPLLLLGALIAGASILVYGAAPTVSALVLLRLVTGVGEALFFVAMLTTFADLAPPERRGEAMSLASLGLYLGIGLGPPFAELLRSVAGLPVVWVVAAGLCVAAAGVAVRVPETRPDVPGPDELGGAAAGAGAPGPTRSRLVHPAGLVPGLLLLASIVGMAGFLAFVPLHVLDVGLASSGGILLLFAGVVVAIRSLGARLPDRLGPHRAIRLALATSATGLGVVAAWHAAAGLVVGAMLLGVGVALLTPSVFALAAAAVPAEERGQVMATTSAFLDIAFGLGPMALGGIAVLFGRPAVFAAAAVAALSGLLLLRPANRG